jgi:uncharacterized protein (TIGR03437 family)
VATAAWAAGGTTGFNYSLSDSKAMIGAIAVDAVGNTYVTGSTCSATFATTPGAFQTQYGGGTCQSLPPGSLPLPSGDAFVVKLDPTGKVVWATYLGGSGEDAGQAIAVDGSGNVYVAGTTAPQAGPGAANTFPVTAGSAFPSGATPNDGFVVKLNAAGSQMIYGTYLPGMAYAGATSSVVSLAIDAGGNAFLAGQAEPAQFNFPTTAGAYQTSSSDKFSGVIAKLNAAGSSLVYATYLDGADPLSIAADSSGEAFVTGSACASGCAFGSGFPITPGTFQTQGGGPFVTKLNASGSGLVYSTFLGTGPEGLAVKVDSQGRAYILGNGGANFPTTPGAFEPTGSPLGLGFQFLASLSADGSSLVYASYVAGAASLDVDASGNAFVGGGALSGFPVSSGAFQRCYSGGENFAVGSGGFSDGFVAQFTPSGALAAATYFGGAGIESVYEIAVASNGYVSVGSGMYAGSAEISPSTRNDFVASLLINTPGQQDGPCMSLVVENAASYAASIPSFVAPGELVTLQGSGFGPDTGVSSPVGGVLSTQLAGVQVFFDELAAPLIYVQAGQINAMVPWELAGRMSTQVQVVYNGVPTNAVSLTVYSAVPGLFYLNYSSSSQGAILNSDGSINSVSNPAKPGDVISLFGTGGGPTTLPGVTGDSWGMGLNSLTLPVMVQIGSVNAQVLYAGAAPTLLSGFFQIDVQIPQDLHLLVLGGPSFDVKVETGGLSTGTPVTVAVQ